MAKGRLEQHEESYKYVTLRSHADHKNFMRKHLAKFIEDDAQKQCASKHSAKCKNRNGFWKVKDFYHSYNDVYDGYFPICKECLIEMTKNSQGELSKRGLARVCTILDIPFLQSEYESALEGKGTSFGLYIKNINLNHKEKRFVDSDESVMHMFASSDAEKEMKKIEVSDEHYMKWGAHYSKEEILTLEYNYVNYMNSYKVDGVVEEKLVRMACSLELQMSKAEADGKGTKDLFKQFSDTLGMLQLKPEQQNTNSDNVKGIGSLIRQIEEHEPIVEDDPRFIDVDGINKYVDRFLTHIMKNFGKYDPTKDGE